MNRKKIIAGNWKMNTDLAGAVALAEALKKDAAAQTHCEIAVCPPFVYLERVANVLQGSNIFLGAQNGYFEKEGAFTGEISMKMLKNVGCHFVILGHSERRNVIHESSENVNLKVHAALAAGLVPIVCVGELLAERETGVTDRVVRRQFEGSLSGVSAADMKKIVIAYEPVWAIGTGKVATPQQAEDVHAMLRALLTERFSKDVSDAVRIQYGGSVKPDNAKELLHQPNIDGALVGGASLKAADFLGIIHGA